MIYSKDEIEAFRKFAFKGPVIHSHTQRAATRYYCMIERYLTPQEKFLIAEARCLALEKNLGRTVFDKVMAIILKRVGLK